MYVWADGELVREIRGDRPAGEVAQEAGISRDTLRRLEGNRGPVRAGTVHAVGRVLDVDPTIFARAISRRRSPQDPRPSRQA